MYASATPSTAPLSPTVSSVRVTKPQSSVVSVSATSSTAPLLRKAPSLRTAAGDHFGKVFLSKHSPASLISTAYIYIFQYERLKEKALAVGDMIVRLSHYFLIE